ncbi:hypothetical protein [Telmatospirillum sp.]|nr:hypothetical protein [Telmatospirillum sp.]MDR3440378.1 hypothetical protein [Telmatospirillum sp.]
MKNTTLKSLIAAVVLAASLAACTSSYTTADQGSINQVPAVNAVGD